jgi:release factor glutamine methyltransferase
LKTIQDLFKKGQSLLQDSPHPSLEAKLLVLKSAGISEDTLYSHPEKEVSKAQETEFFRLISKRREGMPLAYVIREKEFWSIPFKVFPGVLIPRPETEILVERVIALSSKNKELIVDVGTGAGVIAVALAKELPRARIIATDISSEALKTAGMNAALQKISSITFGRGNLYGPLKKLRLQGKCDFIVSNPPYVSEKEWPSLQMEIRDYEPKQALVAGEDGLELIQDLIQGAPEYLRPGGHLCLEIGQGQKEKAISLFGDGWKTPQCFHDLSGISRVIIAQLQRRESFPHKSKTKGRT